MQFFLKRGWVHCIRLYNCWYIVISCILALLCCRTYCVFRKPSVIWSRSRQAVSKSPLSFFFLLSAVDKDTLLNGLRWLGSGFDLLAGTLS